MTNYSRKCSRRQCDLTEYKTSYYQERPNEAAKAIAIVGKDERTGVRGVTVLNKSSNVGAETTTVRPVSNKQGGLFNRRRVTSSTRSKNTAEVKARHCPFEAWMKRLGGVQLNSTSGHGREQMTTLLSV